MIHTSKDARATAAICSCDGQNPQKAKLKEATLNLITGTPGCIPGGGGQPLWRDTQALRPATS